MVLFFSRNLTPLLVCLQAIAWTRSWTKIGLCFWKNCNPHSKKRFQPSHRTLLTRRYKRPRTQISSLCSASSNVIVVEVCIPKMLLFLNYKSPPKSARIARQICLMWSTLTRYSNQALDFRSLLFFYNYYCARLNTILSGYYLLKKTYCFSKLLNVIYMKVNKLNY